MRVADVEREAHPVRDRVDETRLDLDLADRPDGAVAGRVRQPLELGDRLGERQRRIEPQVHRRRARVVAAAVDDDVRVHVACDRVDDADPVAGVLQDAGLLDVHLDPAGEVVEDVAALAPLRGLVPGRLCMLPEAPPVVDRAEALPQLLLGHPLGDDPAAEQHLAEARALLLEERDQLQRQPEPELLVETADLERRDDAQRAVVLAAVAVRVAMRADPEDGLAPRAVPRYERADRILVDLEAERLELAGEVVERSPVDVRVRVAPDRLVGQRVVAAGERLDVPLDPLRAPLPVDSRRPRSHR
jgi:hypothetical protein